MDESESNLVEETNEETSTINDVLLQLSLHDKYVQVIHAFV